MWLIENQQLSLTGKEKLRKNSSESFQSVESSLTTTSAFSLSKDLLLSNSVPAPYKLIPSWPSSLLLSFLCSSLFLASFSFLSSLSSLDPHLQNSLDT